MAKRKTYKQVGNSRVAVATWTSILGAKAFRVGFEDKHRGRPFDPDRFRDSREQWSYERGRLLASVYSGPLKDGRTVCREAIYAAVGAVNDKVFI